MITDALVDSDGLALAICWLEASMSGIEENRVSTSMGAIARHLPRCIDYLAFNQQCIVLTQIFIDSKI